MTASGHSADAMASVFPPGYRACGILLHFTSLPTACGIGDLGPAAFAWIDRLAAAGQGWWQVLPFGPPGKGNSPYDPLSTFAGNEMLISPDGLIDDGLLAADDASPPAFPSGHVDFDAAKAFKRPLLERAH